jgi:hypothetical protein
LWPKAHALVHCKRPLSRSQSATLIEVSNVERFCRGRDGERRRRSVAERGMRPSGVVVNTPVLDDHLSLLQAVEDLAIQAFVPELCSVIPASLQADAILLPCPCITSICRSLVTICSAAKFFLGIFLLLPRLISLIPPGLEKAGQVTPACLKSGFASGQGEILLFDICHGGVVAIVARLSFLLLEVLFLPSNR